MNEEEYLQMRIKHLEEIIKNKNLPVTIRINQQKALQNYRNDLEILQKKLF